MAVQKYTGPDWEDVRIFLAIARGGSLSAAARALGITHSTAGRRVHRLEAAFGGRPLLERANEGYVLTAVGRAAFADAEAMERAADKLSLAAEAADDMVGPVRISSISSFIEQFLSPFAAVWAVEYPLLQLELVGEDRNVRLSRGEADIAVRFGRPQKGEAVARLVGSVTYHLFATEEYLHTTRPERRRFIGFPRLTGAQAVAARIKEIAGSTTLALRCSGFAGQAAAAAAGAGLVLLPAYLGAMYPRLTVVTRAVWSQPIWLAVRPDVRRVARVRRIADTIAAAIASQAVRLRG